VGKLGSRAFRMAWQLSLSVEGVEGEWALRRLREVRGYEEWRSRW